MAEVLHKQLQEASASAEKLRENLFAISQDAMREGHSDWGLIEGLFGIIKKAELLRREIDALRGIDGIRASSDAPFNRDTHNRVSKEGYPKYSLRDGSIVRTGIGQNGFYEHIVKRRDFDKIIEVINRFAESDGFSVDQVLKGLDLPSYLTYLVVSLLKEKLGELESPKRGRYRFKNGKPLNSSDLIAELRVSGDEESP